MEQNNPYKIYVETVAEFSADGQLKPLWIVWEDGCL